jgi:protein-tyrosine phosphatase
LNEIGRRLEWAIPVGYVDLHSHVLPALDDGAPALAEGLALTTRLRDMGFEVVCATPHQKSGVFVPSRTAIDEAHAALAAALAERAIAVELRLGAENFWDELFLARTQTAAQPTYSGGRAFLVELDVRVAPPRLEETLFQMRLGGLLPVLAHPERYAPLWFAPDRVEALRRTAALVVDLGALDGAHGQRECDAARRLVKEGLAHAVASDVHSLADTRSAGAGMAWIKKRLGPAALTRLLDENPRRILQGDLPD